MSGIVVHSKFAKLLHKQSSERLKDFYSGKIPIECDEDCPEDCCGPHGVYGLPNEFVEIFKVNKDKGSD